MNVRDAFYEILRTHGITTIFGNPGSNGVQADRVTTLSDLTRTVKEALTSDEPHLIEISERRLADS